MIFCFFSGDINISLGISVSLSTVAEVFCGVLFENFVVLLAAILLIRPPFSSSLGLTE